jgi:hypothetical protein
MTRRIYAKPVLVKRDVGVMAQDVLRQVPEAVITGASGLMRVDYARLGTRMMSWAEWEATRLAEAA